VEIVADVETVEAVKVADVLANAIVQEAIFTGQDQVMHLFILVITVV
jgi:hypothetical protein